MTKIVCDCGKEHEIATTATATIDKTLISCDMIWGITHSPDKLPFKDVKYNEPVGKGDLKVLKVDVDEHWKPEYITFDNGAGGAKYAIEYISNAEKLIKLLGYDLKDVLYYLPMKEAPLLMEIQKGWYVSIAPRSRNK